MNRLTYRIELKKLERKLSKESKALGIAIAAAKKEGMSEQEALASYSLEYQLISEKIDFLKSRYLISKANKLSLPVPTAYAKENEDYWERSQYDGKYYLSEKGYHSLQAAIRKEQKERLEVIIPIITAITGLIGVVIGLVAVFKSNH